jgi:hypothetical protein
MRWLLATLALCAGIIIVAVTVKRVIDVLSWFAPERAGAPALVPVAPPRAVDTASSTLGPAARLPPRADEPWGASSSRLPPDLSETLNETLRSTPRAVPRNPNGDAPGIARDFGHKLAGEAREHAAESIETMQRNPEIEHELLETLKEQQQILAGKRDTVDSVLEKAR